MDNYIRTEILEQAPLHPYQYAYQVCSSTVTTLIQLTDEIPEALNSKETVVCAFLDIEDAFDNTPHEAVKRALDDESEQNDIQMDSATSLH